MHECLIFLINLTSLNVVTEVVTAITTDSSTPDSTTTSETTTGMLPTISGF